MEKRKVINLTMKKGMEGAQFCHSCKGTILYPGRTERQAGNRIVKI